jgi:hypothetical protein
MGIVEALATRFGGVPLIEGERRCRRLDGASTPSPDPPLPARCT